MGWYRVEKVVQGRRYVYLQRSYREGGKVRTESRYLGPVSPAEPPSQFPGFVPFVAAVNAHSAEEARSLVRCLLESREFFAFLSGDVPGDFPIAVLRGELLDRIGAGFHAVLLSQETLRKQQRKHREVNADGYRFLQALLDEGEIVQDGDRHVIVYGWNGQWWTAILKGTRNGEAYLQSYHRSNPDHVRRIRKRGL